MKQRILIIGGGFAGVSAIRTLLHHKNNLHMEITLVDKNTYHLFTPSLYEVATSEAPQGTIVIPFFELFGNSISYLQGQVSNIKYDEQIVIVNSKQIAYDYLIICAGSIPAYHHIPGLKQHSMPLKTLSDAIRIKEKIKSLCCEEGKCNKKVRLIIGGGGFSGTELAAELLTYKDRLAKQYHLDKNCLNTTIIQGSSHLLNELDIHVSQIAENRLKNSLVHFAFGGHIKNVTTMEIQTDNNKTYPYDLFIWTGGVEANKLAAESKLPVNQKGQVMVNDFLQISDTIFAAGDIAGYVNKKTQHPVPNVAQVAEEQGAVAGENVCRQIAGKPLIRYQFQHLGYIVPLRGRFAAAELMGWLHFDGYVGWFLQQLVFFRYLLGILPFWKAFSKWNKFEMNLHQ